MFDLSWLPWLYVNIAPDARERLDLPGIKSRKKAAEAWPDVAAEYRGWLPLAELPHLREVAPYYFEWLEHPPEAAWWNWAEIRGRYGTIDAAVLNLSSWYDEAYGPEGAVTNFRGLLAARQSVARSRTHLLLGPWTHGVGATMSRQAGDVDFGAAAAIDYGDEILDFFDHYLRGIDNRFASELPVRYFVMGENRWHSAAQWPPSDVRSETLYLVASDEDGLQLSANPAPANGEANGDSHSSFPEEANGDSHSSFVADPDDPVVDPYGQFGPHDYRMLAERDDLLTFDSAPFTEAIRVAGAIEAIIHASCECRDFDLWVRVLDVHPDGRAVNLMSPGNDMLRASYRQPETGRQLLEPGRVYELRLPNLLTGHQFAPGHRLRVQVSASFAPHFSRNLQTGKSEVYSSVAREATISIHHDREHPSRIRLPVVERLVAQ